jgi:dipeptidyl aminopeptidase/acylaminoacyl peptidase
MERLRNVALFFLLSMVLRSSVPAQTNAPGFDPTPVEIPDVKKIVPRAVTSMDLLNLRDLYGIQISPDGRNVAFVLGQAVYESNSYRTGLFVISTERDGTLLSLGTAGPPDWDERNEWSEEAPQWSADSKCLYRRLKSIGIWQVWRWSRDGGAPVQVTHVEHNVTSFHVTPDNRKLIMRVEKPSTVEKNQLAEHGILYDGSISEIAAGPILDRIVEMHESGSESWVHDLQTGIDRNVSDEELDAYAPNENDPNSQIFSKTFGKKKTEKDHIHGLEISPDREKVAYIRDAMGDSSESAQAPYALRVRSMDGVSDVPLAGWIYYYGQYWWSPDSKEIYYTQTNDVGAVDQSTLMAVAATGEKARQVLAFPGFLRAYSIDRSGRLLACLREDETTPPTVTLADLATGTIRTLIDVNPEFSNLKLSPARRIDVDTKYGDHLWGHLTLPIGYEPGKRYPLIITTYRDYGGFLRGGDPGDEYPIPVFVANGFAVLNFEALGRVRNDKLNDLDFVLLQSPITGLAAAVAKLTEIGVVDGSRVGITGLSFGAELVDYGISHSGLFQAAIDSGAGSPDPFSYYIESEENRAAVSQFFGLASPDGKSLTRWQMISPALNARRIRTPLLINAADAEYTADMELVTALREMHKPIELFIYANERHEKNQPKHRYEIYERNVDWFKFWLQNKEDSDAAKIEQYKRWRELRKMQENNFDTATPAP